MDYGCMITTSTTATRGTARFYRRRIGGYGWIVVALWVLGGFVFGKVLLRATAYGYLPNISHLLSRGLLFLVPIAAPSIFRSHSIRVFLFCFLGRYLLSLEPRAADELRSNRNGTGFGVRIS